MNTFSKTSLSRLETCHPLLQTLFCEILKTDDCTIICGNRGEKEQNEAYSAGKSGVQFPCSRHNAYPSLAVDVAPYPIDWADTGRFYMFAGKVKMIASQMIIGIRYGGDWDGDSFTKDQKFNDLVHFELCNYSIEQE